MAFQKKTVNNKAGEPSAKVDGGGQVQSKKSCLKIVQIEKQVFKTLFHKINWIKGN